MSAGPDYKGVFRRMMAKNAAEVIPALDRREGWLWEKIANAAERYATTEDEIAAALRECAVLRFYFAKDPKRQGMHENAAAEFIAAIDGVGEFARPPQQGKNAVFIAGGKVVKTAELRALRVADRQRTYSKSVDFLWRFGGRHFYAYHKFTEAESGGAQGNQGNDVRTFLRESVKNDAPESAFVALCDGGFYTAPNGIVGKSRMDGLTAMAAESKHGNVFAMTTGELPAFLRRQFPAITR